MIILIIISCGWMGGQNGCLSSIPMQFPTMRECEESVPGAMARFQRFSDGLGVDVFYTDFECRQVKGTDV